MAEQKSKQFTDEQSIATSTEKGLQEKMEKLKFEKQRVQFDAKIKELATKAADFYQKYGEEDWRTNLLVNFLELSLQMQDIIEVVSVFNIANEIIADTLNLMNTSIQMSNGVMIEMGSHTTSTFKQRMIIRRAMSNNKKTVKNMIAQMKSSIQMASLTAGMYEGLSDSIADLMNSMNAKRAKKRAKSEKKAGDKAPATTSGRGMDMIKGILGEQGAAVPQTSPTRPAPTPKAPDGDSGLDGVL